MSRNKKVQEPGLADIEKTWLLTLTRKSLLQEKITGEDRLTEHQWMQLLQLARQHTVLPLFYDLLEPVELPEMVRVQLTEVSRRTVRQSYHLLEVTHQLVEALGKEGIAVVILKGVAAAACYPVPELRKSGDVDLLLQKKEDLSRTESVLTGMGFSTRQEQHGVHHLGMRNGDGIEVEIHTLLAEPFEQAVSDKFLEQCTVDAGRNIEWKEIMGYELPVLGDAFQALELLLHMLQHFLHSGFGLKLLCDWVCFWNQEIENSQMEYYLQMVQEAGLNGFSNMVTSVCIYDLGLSADSPIASRSECFPREDCELFLADILEGGEFGASQKGRMIVLRGTHIWDYIREFHYQMHRNFPQAGRVVVFWPALWGVTLWRFLVNNRKIRRVSTREILKKSKKRSLLVKKLKLF